MLRLIVSPLGAAAEAVVLRIMQGALRPAQPCQTFSLPICAIEFAQLVDLVQPLDLCSEEPPVHYLASVILAGLRTENFPCEGL